MKSKALFLLSSALFIFSFEAEAKICKRILLNPYFITVANRLPVTGKVENNEVKIANAGGGLVAGLRSIKDFTWIGWPGNEIPTSYRKQLETSMQQKDVEIKPVYISDSEKKSFYDEFSNRILWPLLHDMKPELAGIEKNWELYQQINLRFARETFKSMKERAAAGETSLDVWVQDYQLMLAPMYLRQMMAREGFKTEAKIGFFLHIPFPSQKSFSQLPIEIQSALMRSLGMVDDLGFHTNLYRDNFIKVAAAHVPKADLEAKARTHPIGTDPKYLRKIQKSPSVQQKIQDLSAQYRGYDLVLSVERLDPIKGIVEKLKGYKLFLESHPEYIGKVVLVQVAQSSRMDLPEYIQLRKDVFNLTREINERFTVPDRLPPVILSEGLNTEETVAHFSVASSVLINSIKDGMNLVALEALAVQKGRANPLNLILSNQTGAAQYLKGSLQIDPTSPGQISDALMKSLTMSNEEKVERLELDMPFVESRTAQAWREGLSD